MSNIELGTLPEVGSDCTPETINDMIHRGVEMINGASRWAAFAGIPTTIYVREQPLLGAPLTCNQITARIEANKEVK